jgi:hypothetical protein
MKDRLLAERKAQAAGAPPVPASKPAASNPAPTARPASAGASPSAARPAVPARPATPARTPASPAPAAKPAAAPGPRPTKPATKHDAHLHKPIPGARTDAPEHPDVAREIKLLRERESKTMMIAWIVCGVLIVGAGIVWGVVQHKKGVEHDAQVAHQALLENYLREATAIPLDTEEGANRLVKYAQDDVYQGTPVHWQQEDYLNPRINSLLTKAQATLQRLSDVKSFEERLAAVESVATNASSKTPDEVVRARRTLKDLSEQPQANTDENKKRISTCRLALEKVYVQRLWDEAKTLASNPANLRAALTSYGKAELACVTLAEGSPGELQEFGRTSLKGIYDESDAVCAQLYKPEYINTQPWTDLLSGDMASQWQDSGTSGFRIDKSTNVLQVRGPDANEGKDGLISVPKQNQWRDFQVEIEFEVSSGRSVFWLRLLRKTDNAVEGPKFTAKENEDDWTYAAKKMTVIITCVGNQLTTTYPGSNGTDKTETIKWQKTRRGGFGATVPPGTDLKIHKMRARILRSDAN